MGEPVTHRGAPMPADAGDGLATARLRLRRFTHADLPLLHRLNSDERVMRYLGGVLSEEETRAQLDNRILRYYEEHPGFGVWATLRRDDGECIGFHLLNHVAGERIVQVGYRLYPEYWSCGYATEMSLALLRYGYVTRGIPVLTANAQPDNAASIRVLLKCGLVRGADRSFSHPMYAKYNPVAYFERSAVEWLAQFPSSQPN